MSKQILEEFTKQKLFLVCDDIDSNFSFWLEVYREKNIFLTDDEVNDYLISGQRKNKNDLFHANKHGIPLEEGDIELTLEDMVYSLVNLRNGIVEKAVQRKNGENSITISFKKNGGRIILIELYSKSAGSLRFKTEWAISDEKYKQKFKSSSNSAGS